MSGSETTGNEAGGRTVPKSRRLNLVYSGIFFHQYLRNCIGSTRGSKQDHKLATVVCTGGNTIWHSIRSSAILPGWKQKVDCGAGHKAKSLQRGEGGQRAFQSQFLSATS